MRFRSILVSMLLLMLGAAAFATTGGSMSARRQSAVVRFDRPTWVATEMLIGSYAIVHDESKMARGEPCTAIYRLGTGRGPGSEVVAFHCIPRQRSLAKTFRVVIDTSLADSADTLVEYQFAGDTEGHGVPMLRRAAINLTSTDSTPMCVR